MKGSIHFGLIPITLLPRGILAALAVVLLASCGGGGGSGSSQSGNKIIIYPQSITISASTAQQAPKASFQVSATGLNPNQTVYLQWTFTNRGIKQVTMEPGNYLPATFSIQFDLPTSLGPGTYDDSIEMNVCYDQRCGQPLPTSPQTVPVKYTITKAPYDITKLSPSSALASSSAFTLDVTGSTFTPLSTVLWNGTPLTTGYVSPTELTAQVTSADISTPGNVSVTVKDPTYGTTNAETFSVQQISITGLSPSSTLAGGPSFTLTVTGTIFTSQSTVLWNGTPLPTTYVSNTQLTAQVPAADITTLGSASITVSDPVNGTTNSETIAILRPPLALNTVSPPSVAAGNSAFTLTALGNGYSTQSVIQWNGISLTTTYVSQNELLALIPASDVSATGSASVTVYDLTNSPTVTSPQTVNIVPPSIDAVTYRMNPGHTGAVTFSSVSFPSKPAWSVNLAYPPTYALIADGKVIILESVSYFKSELVAFDQATGNMAWGPIQINGYGYASYDNGRVFVQFSPIGTSGFVSAYDVNTGALDWSTLLPSLAFLGINAPTAAYGNVYSGGVSTLYDLDEITGSVLWSAPYQNQDDTLPTVTADGVYISFPCMTYDFRPATGETIWNYSGSSTCGGGIYTIPIITNQLLYSPDRLLNNVFDIFNAETGALNETYTLGSVPAFTTNMAYYLQSGTLYGDSLTNGSIQWNFTGDGQLTGAPIAVNQYVFIGSSSGNLYALDGATGTQVWNVNLGAAIGGLSAGDGLLVVPAGNTVTAYVLSTSP